MAEPRQGALPLKVSEKESFDTFVQGDSSALIEAMRKAASAPQWEFFMVTGPHGCGKSHLLNAIACENPGTFSIDLALARDFSPQFLDVELPGCAVLDNVDAIAGDGVWEMALFGLFNRWYDGRRGALFMSSTSSADRIPFARHDLNTRLMSGVTVPLAPLSDEDSAKALGLKAAARGITLPEQSCAYLVRSYGRDLRKLSGILDKLDCAQLERSHALSIPFIKSALGADQAPGQ
ncbi:MAG: DnaA/Hda family protein [Aeromonadales bacterium]|nr:DnaA/Hda family protein [Aeromonadales bacterium]MDY2891562.1 DnaA/Hda family protein [Succinivibrio sp.]